MNDVIYTSTPSETQELGRKLGHFLREQSDLTFPVVIALCGELGTGKTTLTQGIAKGLDITEPVTSPTFTLVNEYAQGQKDRVRLIHMDSYRLGDTTDLAPLEAATFGIDEVLESQDAVIVIEWADRLRSILPLDHLMIQLEYPDSIAIDEEETKRRIVLQASGPQSQVIVLTLRSTSLLKE